MHCYGCREYHAEGDHHAIRAKRATVKKEPLPCNVIPLGDMLFVNYQPPKRPSVGLKTIVKAAVGAAVFQHGMEMVEGWLKTVVLVLALALGIGGVACGGDLDAMPDGSSVDAEVVSVDAEVVSVDAEVVSVDAEVDAFEMVCPLDEEFQTLECDGCNLFFGGTCYACTLYNGAAPIITVAGHCCNFDCCKGWDFPDGGVCP